MSTVKTYRVKTIGEFHKLKGLPQPLHPLISLIDYGTMPCMENQGTTNWVYDFYNIAIKKGIGAKLKYGQQQYDFDDGLMFFVAPNQVFGVEPILNPTEKRTGWMLLIHPDFFWNTSLAKTIKNYDFFDYSVHEALFLSDKEENILNAIVKNIEQEYQGNLDKFSQNIIISQIETMLNYSERFYQRQFITRKISSHKILENLEALLDSHFSNNEIQENGLPTVQAVAESLHVSPTYLSSLLKSLTGQSTQQHIHEKLIEKAKIKLSTTNLTVAEIAFGLGFEHSQSFSKLFKNKTKQSPLEFRASFN